MENDETQDVALEEQNNEVSEEELNTLAEQPQEDTTDWKAEALKFKGIASRLAKKLKKPQEPQPEQTVEKAINPPEPPKSELTRDEVEVLLLKSTKNYEDSLIDELKAIAKGKGVSLLQAETSEAFQALLEKRQDEKKKAEAKLGTSKGSGKNAPKPIGELTREEHMKLWEERMGK